MQSRMVVNAGPLCPKGLSPQSELSLQFGEDCRRHHIIACTGVAAIREVLPGRQDLPEYASAPVSPVNPSLTRRVVILSLVFAPLIPGGLKQPHFRTDPTVQD